MSPCCFASIGLFARGWLGYRISRSATLLCTLEGEGSSSSLDRWLDSCTVADGHCGWTLRMDIAAGMPLRAGRRRITGWIITFSISQQTTRLDTTRLEGSIMYLLGPDTHMPKYRTYSPHSQSKSWLLLLLHTYHIILECSALAATYAHRPMRSCEQETKARLHWGLGLGRPSYSILLCAAPVDSAALLSPALVSFEWVDLRSIAVLDTSVIFSRIILASHH
ncbi:hypothetical protein BZA05DRAFT_238272 [Tricharina praecox]|uniref:uncharacterized protein n=1 Tax=Tricharina praecox TaxID=43433 RepID=UPI002221091D|nr:uncharacterized protein BZA05DRAFT_238272 [Tricharina praecox]KAI5855359.1 hypothetical protein BZA05DRAFT_238272 [Tricharina praecox]